MTRAAASSERDLASSAQNFALDGRWFCADYVVNLTATRAPV